MGEKRAVTTDDLAHEHVLTIFHTPASADVADQVAERSNPCRSEVAAQVIIVLNANPSAFHAALQAQIVQIITIEAEGHYAKAKELSERLGVVRPEVHSVLDRLAGIPVDIEPKFTTAAQLLTR